MCVCLPVNYPSFLSGLIKLEFCRQIFEKYPIIKCNENPFSVDGVVPRGETDRPMAKRLVVFRKFANHPPPPKVHILQQRICMCLNNCQTKQ